METVIDVPSTPATWSLKNFLRGMETPPMPAQRAQGGRLKNFLRGMETRSCAPRRLLRRVTSKTSLEGWKLRWIGLHFAVWPCLKNFLRGMETVCLAIGRCAGNFLKNFLRGMETAAA